MCVCAYGAKKFVTLEQKTTQHAKKMRTVIEEKTRGIALVDIGVGGSVGFPGCHPNPCEAIKNSLDVLFYAFAY